MHFSTPSAQLFCGEKPRPHIWGHKYTVAHSPFFLRMGKLPLRELRKSKLYCRLRCTPNYCFSLPAVSDTPWPRRSCSYSLSYFPVIQLQSATSSPLHPSPTPQAPKHVCLPCCCPSCGEQCMCFSWFTWSSYCSFQFISVHQRTCHWTLPSGISQSLFWPTVENHFTFLPFLNLKSTKWGSF